MLNNVADTTYFSIQAWMVTKLNLKGCERDVYAIIYGYSQDGESDYHGSLGYMAELTGYSKNSICTALKNLTEKELITKSEKEINNIKFCRYQINRDSIQSICTPVQSTCTNTNINNNNTKKSNSKELLQDFQFGKSKPKKPDLFSRCISILDSYDFSIHSDIRKLAIEYLRYRMNIKDKPLYVNMWKGMLNKLVALCDNDIELYTAVIQQSIERGYLAFYPVAVNNKSKNVMRDIEGLNHSESMTDEDYRQLDKLTEERRRRGLQAEF